MNFWQYLQYNSPEISQRFFEHLQLTLFSVSLSVVIGVPLGILISYVRSLKKPILGFANVMQAIPSLALLGFLIPFLGIGVKPAIFMVVVYSLLPIIKNTSTGMDNISADLIEAARGMGMTRLQILTKVKLPLALPIIMAGLRISAVTSVGLVTLAAFVGAGGLGYLVYSGIRTVNNFQILAGAIPACMLALGMDFIVSLIEKAVTPLSFTDKIKSADKSTIKKYQLRKKITLSITGVALVGILTISFSSSSPADRVLKLGAKDYTEQNILGQLYAQLITENSNIKVDLKSEMGSQVVFQALTSGNMDLYIEYTGTLYGNILNQTESRTPEEIYLFVQEQMASIYNLTVLDPLGFNNTYTLAVTPEIAKKYNLKTFSDLALAAPHLTLGASFELLNRADGIINLTKLYQMEFKKQIAIEGAPRYAAISKNEIQVTDAFSTDGLLEEFKLVVLEDDKKYFPPYYAVPLIRTDTLKEFPELEAILDTFTQFFDDEMMRQLNFQVDVEKKNPYDVAREFLLFHHFI